ncbi:putative membrane protein [Actinacidiphila reveromycinica]|uniref:Putative membrane protein n=1 Tax=Actinacidiphila reveromycinica TaxID=659352 RepID=A0A7U3VSS7_9ACTN|nr:YihY/virulence factor BrkB family protein [Streptomyces sp. SN-593]BBB02145.1 putative membrane protein [Streptomyces sp. SN-593]
MAGSRDAAGRAGRAARKAERAGKAVADRGDEGPGGPAAVEAAGRPEPPAAEPPDPEHDPEHGPAPDPAPDTRPLRRARAVWRFGRTLVRAVAAAWEKDVTERAAALTYYAVLALFPALLMTVSLLGMAGGPSESSLSAGVTAMLPSESRPVVVSALQDMAHDHRATLSLAIGSGLGAMWSASSYAAVFRRALHAMYGVDGRRPAWRTGPRVVLTSLTLLVLLVASAVCLVVTGAIAHRTGSVLHMSGPAQAAWRGLRWPLLLVTASALVLVLFRTGPRGTRTVRAMAPGGALAVVLWLAASAGFAAYTARMGTYNRLYGPLASTVIFLVWLWFSNLALMIGAHFNVEHARAVAERAAAAKRGGGAGTDAADGGLDEEDRRDRAAGRDAAVGAADPAALEGAADALPAAGLASPAGAPQVRLRGTRRWARG